MAEKQWPPAWWPFPLKDDSWLAVIPYMDAMQWLYESAKEVVNMIPHQPPVFTRTVEGYVLSLSGTREKIALGSVGYNAEKRKVLVTTNRAGGTAVKTIELDVSVVFPMLTVLLSRLPWDVVAELNNAVMSGMSDKDKRRFAANGISDNKMIVRWLTDKVRTTAGDNGISLPALNGSYSTTDKLGEEGFASLVPNGVNLALYNIPVMDYCQAIYEAMMELVETINHHPPAASFPVIARGFYPTFNYVLSDDEEPYDNRGTTMPAVDAVAGKTLKVVLTAESDNSVTDWNDLDDPAKTYDYRGPVPCNNVELVSREFLPSASSIVYTSAENEPDPNIEKGMVMYLPLPNGYSVRAVVSDVQQGTEGQEQHGEEGDADYQPPVAPAPTVFTVAVSAKTVQGKGNAIEQGVDLSAAGNGIYGEAVTLKAVCTEDGWQSVSEGMEATLDGLNNFKARVTKVISEGTDAPEDDETGGTGEQGTPAVVELLVWNVRSGTAQQYLEPPEFDATINSVTYSVALEKPVQLHNPPSLTYTAQIDGPTKIQAVPEKISVEVSAPVYAAGTFFRWQEPEELSYVGKELDVQLGMHGVSSGRYVLARIKYRYATDRSGHYRYAYSSNHYRPKDGKQLGEKQCGYGNCHPMDIKYNSSTRIVTLIDRLGGDELNIKLSACVWFAMQLLMLIPVTVI
jgi:hypothetical protein